MVWDDEQAAPSMGRCGGWMGGAMVEWMLGVFLNDVLHHLGLVGGGGVGMVGPGHWGVLVWWWWWW